MSDAASLQILTDPVQQATCVKCGCAMETVGLPAFSPIVCPQCGHDMQVPARLGNFLLTHLIGTGGMGGVYWARDQILNRDVAIKVMLKKFGDDRKFVETFLREAQAAARLNHPHIAQIYSFGQEKGQPYIVMELVAGGGLDKLMAATPKLNQALAMRIGAEVAEGLKRANNEGLIHSDIKPENILIGEEGEAKLVDFGIASLSGGQSHEIWGTPYYIAPEKVRRKKIDHRSDIYSLGGTLYHALTGAPPFDGPNAVAVVKARFSGPPRPMVRLRKDIDPEIAAIVARMLHIEPFRRYPTYDSLLSDMRHYMERAGPGQITAGKTIVLKHKGGGETAGNIAGGQPTGRFSAPPNVSDTTTNRRIVLKKGEITGTFRREKANIAGGQPTYRFSIPSNVPDTTTNKRVVLQKGEITGGYRMERANAGKDDDAAADERSRKGMRAALMIFGLLVLSVVFMVAGVFWSRSVKNKRALVAAERAERARTDAMRSIREAVLRTEALPGIMAERVVKGTTLTDEAAKTASDMLDADARASLVPPRPVAPLWVAGTNASPVVDDGDPASYPPLVRSVRDMYLELYRLQASANALDAQIADLLVAARAADSPNHDVEALQVVATDLTSRIAAMENHPVMTRSKKHLQTLTNAFENVRRQVENLRAEKTRAEEERKQLEAERATREEAERLEAERLAAIKAEVERVRALESENLDRLRKFEFQVVRRALAPLADDLKSDEGHKALALALERVERLAELHAFLVGRVVGYIHPVDGWTVQAADLRGLTVGGMEVPWGEVGEVRMVLFINTFLEDERQAREIRLRERVRQSINGALYCVMFVKDSAPVRELAGKLVSRAIELLPASKEDAQRLMPELIKE